VRNKEWLKEELGRTETNYATAKKAGAEYREFLDKQSEAGESEELGQQRMAKRSLLFTSMRRGLILMLCVVRRIDRIKTWLDSNYSYRDVYEHRLRQRHPNTCAWFLDDEKYCRWRSIPFDNGSANNTDRLENDWQHRVLFVQGQSHFRYQVIEYTVAEGVSSTVCRQSLT
jgi:hypothetical protein